MEININNYEIILVDYFDGKLNALEVAEVLLFLEQHPNIKNEFEAFGTLPEAIEASIDTDFKTQLKKHSNLKSFSNKTFDELIVAQIEGEFDEKENAALNNIINSNYSLEKLKKAFQLTQLVPDLKLVYPNKSELKRKEAVIFYLSRKFAAAAAILLISAMLFLVYKNSGNEIQHSEIADNSNHKNSLIDTQKAVPQNRSNLKNGNEIVVESTNLGANKNSITNTNINKKGSNPNQKNIPVQLKQILQIEKENNTYFAMHLMPIKKIENKLLPNENINLNINDELKPLESISSLVLANKEENFLTLNNWIKKKFIERGQNNLIENEKPFQEEELVIDPMTVASVGAGIIEKTTGKKVSLSRSYNKAGSVKSYTFAAGNFKYERIK